MRLIRFAIWTTALHPDQPIPEEWNNLVAGNGPIQLQTNAVRTQGGQLGLLISAVVPLLEYPAVDGTGAVIVPDSERRDAERAIENFANVLAIASEQGRTLSSPFPYVGLLMENDEDRRWCEQRSGFAEFMRVQNGFRHQVSLEILSSLVDERPDGLALLAEALSHQHPTGRFHEFMRLFERAFAVATSRLTNPLTRYLMSAPSQGFTHREVANWVATIRGPATHADRREAFLLEQDIRPVIMRMEQAAYDVLLNKADWRNPSYTRRNAWSPNAVTSQADTHLLTIVQGTAPVSVFQMLDMFGSYPSHLGAVLSGHLPTNIWSPDGDSNTTSPNEHDTNGP